MTPIRPVRPALVAVLAALVAAGCSGGGSEATPGATTSSATPTSSAPTPSGGDPTDPPGSARGIPTKAEVQVVGLEGGCVYVAVGDAERWALRGEVPDVAVGDRLTVSGAPDDTDYPDCPEGRPFLVSSVAPIG